MTKMQITIRRCARQVLRADARASAARRNWLSLGYLVDKLSWGHSERRAVHTTPDELLTILWASYVETGKLKAACFLGHTKRERKDLRNVVLFNERGDW